jgi:hypothetical protein
MKNSLFAIVAGLALSGFALAQDPAAAPKPVQDQKPVMTEQAQPMADQAKVKGDLSAEIVSVDAAKKTITLKNASGEWTLPVEGAAVDSLKTLKAGDKVTATLRHDDKGAPAAITGVKSAPAIK